MSITYSKLYDEKSKKILSDKQVLANIMKECIPEYRNLSRKEIIDCIEDGGDSRYITGLPTDDLVIEKAEVKYDILFTSRLPNSNERIGMYIDIEPQNKFYPGYPIVKRAIYYAARLISSQKKRGSNYSNIKKVYSIWICTTPSKSRCNTINRYRIIEENIKGNYLEVPDNYELINIIILNLDDNYNSFIIKEGVLEMLGLIFKSNTENIDKTNNLLRNRYDIIYSNKEALDMPTLSYGIKQEGIREGRKIGRIEGRLEGRLEGKQEGIKEGFLNATINNIDSLVLNGFDLNKAFELLNIKKELQDKVIEYFKTKQEN